MIRRFLTAFAPLPLLLALALAAALWTFTLLVATLTHGRAAEIPLPPPPGFGAVAVPAAHVTVIIHGVNDDGSTWMPRFKRELARVPPRAVYGFHWAQPDGRLPALGHARNCLRGVAERLPDHPEAEAHYQLEEAHRLAEFLKGARELYREFGVDGQIDVAAHSQGSLVTLAALKEGAEVDNVVFMGSPLCYTGERQDDVIAGLPHIRGVLYNYVAADDLAVRFMGGGIVYEPRGWPTADLPPGKVVQVRLTIGGHTGYYSEGAVTANYRDKLGLQPGERHELSAAQAAEFTARWDRLVQRTGLIDPQLPSIYCRSDPEGREHTSPTSPVN